MVNTEIRLIIFFAAKDGEALYSQQKQDQKVTVAQIMNSLLRNQTFREDQMPILLKHFQKIAEEVTLSNSFYEATVTLITKPDKDNTQKRKLQANITDEHR